MSKSSNIQNSIIGTGRPVTAPRAAVRGIDFSSPLVLDASFALGALPAASAGISAVIWVRKTVNSGRYVIDGGNSAAGNAGGASVRSGAPNNTLENGFNALLGGSCLVGSGNGEFSSNGLWKCLFFSGNNNFPIAFINDTEITYPLGRSGAFPINFSNFDNFTIGSSVPIRGAGNNWAQDIADVWVSYSTKLDFSAVGIRRAFLTAGGTAVTLASDGTVFGTRPEFYFSVRAGEPLANYRVNRGSVALTNPGALLTLRSGVLTASLTSPA